MDSVRNRRYKKRFLKLASRVAHLDRLVVKIADHFSPKEIAQQADVLTSIYRAKYRSQDDYQYVDPVTRQHHVLHLCLIHNKVDRLAYQAVIGLLYDGKMTTGVHYSDANGDAFISWEGFVPNELETILVNGQSYPGPYRANGNYLIYMDSPSIDQRLKPLMLE